MAEVEDAQQRDAGLWAKCFAEADGEESRAKAAYIKTRVDQLVPKPATGYCPNCNYELLLKADACPNCKAIFDHDSSWAPTEKPQAAAQPRKISTTQGESGSGMPAEAKSAPAGFKWWLWVPIALVVAFFLFPHIAYSPAQRAAISARADCERVFPLERGGKCESVYNDVLRRHSGN
ncbi:hypothetical protein [Acidovorax sp. KKS102]|uniref:hypothetical protein n=1 Tax=Acidovorax sp. KKS102 TaxID=358220 RepID=UPI0005B87245|nr:hypothetical protein [Acidovorax sp. KKS102]